MAETSDAVREAVIRAIDSVRLQRADVRWGMGEAVLAALKPFIASELRLWADEYAGDGPRETAIQILHIDAETIAGRICGGGE
jgi:hypothetical protein